ncbi:T9SS type A sorting domain-containing protein [Arundinibacter roseus]|uniref:T9SS type A sorting domain-containing protein n=1 Tax=Arundinibacter roseus TaxID=2070510 RepID=A0A4R4KGH6_9BACT|nr:T9SS type A sorting domain-containing protein [Arundinibacter roseus]TDB66032.1 T9SS type A sorting domain-containing protein [Arundinibacter roseus]
MQRRYFTHWLVVGLIVLGWVSESKAQTITTSALAVSEICGGTSLSVPFSTTGVFGAGNTFSVQLSNAAGSFASPRTLAPSGAASPIIVTIPSDVANGNAYRVRVVSSSPQVIGSTSGTVLSIQQTPAAPVVPVTSFSYCKDAPATPLTATASGGNTLQWYNAGGGAIAGPPTISTASTGTQNFSVSQITTGGCESARVPISIEVFAIPAAPIVSTPLEICAGSGVSALTATGNSLKWYDSSNTLLGGAPTPSNTTSSSYSVSQTINGCESPKSTITVTVKAKPAPPAVANVTACFGATISTLTATGSALKWYTSNDTPLGSAPVPGNTANSSYKVTQTVGGCESDKATITVTITQTPLPTVNSALSYCVGESAPTLTATGTALKWYSSNSGGSPLAGAPTPSTGSPGTFNFYVSQTIDGCESGRAQIVVTVKAIPAAPTVSPVSVCEGSSTGPLTATGANLTWYAAASGGSGSGTAPTPSTATVGTSFFYVSQTVNGCESPRTQLSVTIRDTPNAPAVTSPVTYCFGEVATALTATGTGLKWYTAAGGALGAAPTPSTAAAGSTTFQVSQTANSCESPKASIVVTVYRTNSPTVNALVEYCLGESAVALLANGTSLKWYTSSAGGVGAATAPIPPTTAVGSTPYFVTQTLNGCESDRARVDVLVKAIPAVPVTTAPAPICQLGTSTSLLGQVSGVTGTLKWYTAATGGTSNATAPIPSTATAGTATFYVSQTVNNCESPRASIAFETKANPTAPTVTALVEYCEKATASPLSATGTALKWYTTPTGTTGVTTTAPTPSTVSVTTTAYYVSQTTTYPVGTGSLACEGPRARINVTINPLPGLPSVISFQEFCQERQDKSFTFSANGTNLKWYTASTGGAGENSAPSINLKEAKETTFYVSQVTDKSCEGSRAEMKVRVKRLPVLPVVSSLIEYCQFDQSRQLTATPETNGILNWYGTNASGGSPSGNAPTPSTADGGETAFFVSQSLEGCEGDRTQILIRINTTPKPAVVTPVEYCQNTTATPLSAQGASLKWYREAAASEFQTNPFTPFTANVGNFAFYVTQTGGNGCESPKEKIDVRIKPLPSATITGDNSISLGQSAQITVTFTGDGPWDYVLSNGLTGKGETQNPLRITVSPSVTTTYVVTEVENVCGKGIPNGSAIVTVRIPTISTGNPTIASLCAGKSFTIPFQASGDFVADNRFNVQISLTEETSGFKTIPSVRTGNEVVATVPDTTLGGNYFVRVVGQSAQFLIPGSISPVNVTVRPLPTATLSGNNTILIGESTTVNVAFTGDSPWTFRFNDSGRDSLITTSVTPFVIPVKPAVTTTYSLTSVTNQCGDGKVSGLARIQVDPILSNEPIYTATWLNAYPSPVQTICVVEINSTRTGDESTIQVTDMNGRSILSKIVRATRTEVDFTDQPAGVYFLSVENGGKRAVKRILKQD